MTPEQIEALLMEAKANLEKSRKAHDDCLLVVARLETMKAILFVETGKAEYAR